MSALARVETALEARDCRKQGRDWTCPAHEDSRASLSITQGDDGRALLHCHGGCEVTDILAALGLTAADLFEKASSNGHREIVAEYPYVDESGKLLYQVVRFAPKDFRQRRPDGNGGWTWKLAETRRVVYRLPAVLKAVKAGKPIYVVEGEKDVEALERIGLTATCNPGGAGKWPKEHSETLRGATVTIIADRDDPGRKHAEAVARSLKGIATSVTVLEPPDPHKDVSDLLAADGSLDALVCYPRDPCDPCGGVEGETKATKPVQLVPAADLLEHVRKLVGTYVILPSDAARDAVALYALHTWAFEAAHATPYILIVSPEKQAGKSRLLEVLELVVRAPWPCLSATEAALFRKIERDRPTLLLDEIDAIFGSNTERTEPLRAVLNGGNRRGAQASRAVGQGTNIEVKDFAIFSPKVLAGIDTGRVPETVVDRSIVIHMQRRRPGETVQRLRWRDAEQQVQPLREQLGAWATNAIDTLSDAEPELPDELSDRQCDAWEPLFAIADVAGGEWPARARMAALSLSGETDDGASRGALLLGAIRDAMEGADVIATASLEEINGNEELPFGGWSDGKGLDGRGLARLLKPYGVRTQTVRLADKTAKGYRRDTAMEDAFARYLCLEPSHASQASHRDEPHADVTDVTDVTDLRGAGEDVVHPNGTETLADRALREYEATQS